MLVSLFQSFRGKEVPDCGLRGKEQSGRTLNNSKYADDGHFSLWKHPEGRPLFGITPHTKGQKKRLGEQKMDLQSMCRSWSIHRATKDIECNNSARSQTSFYT